MKQIKPWMPEQLETIEGDTDFLLSAKEQEERVGAKLFKKVNAEGVDFSLLCFSKVRFENCCFLECSFEKCEFVDAIFQSCNFSNCIFTDSYFHRCRIFTSKGIGANFSGSSLLSVEISDCSLNYMNLDASKLENVKIRNTELNSANISQCRCKEVEWDRVQLNNASLFKTYLNGMDFTTSVIDGLILSDECRELKGVIVDLYQAAELAKRMGVVIGSSK